MVTKPKKSKTKKSKGKESKDKEMKGKTKKNLTQGEKEEIIFTWARNLVTQHDFATMKDTGDVLKYIDGVYIHENRFIEMWCEKRLQGKLSKHKLSEIIGHVQRMTYRDREEFDKDLEVINVKNGLLYLHNGEIKLKPHTPKHLSMIQIPVPYNPEADCPKFREFVSEVLFEEDNPMCWEWMGYQLYRSLPSQKQLLAIGGGWNGKGTWLRILEILLGAENVAHASMYQLNTNRFAPAELFKKLANIRGELPSKKFRNDGIILELTGNDPIQVERKGKDPFNFANHAKLTFASKDLPDLTDKESYPWYRRLLVLNFPFNFEGNRNNPNKFDLCTTEEELSGILRFAVEGLQRLMSNDWNFTNAKTVAEMQHQCLMMTDSVKCFIDNACRSSGEPQTKDGLVKGYEKYCRFRNLEPVTNRQFTSRLKQHVPDIKDKQFRVKGTKKKKVWCWVGLKFMPVTEWRDEPGEDGYTLDEHEKLDALWGPKNKNLTPEEKEEQKQRAAEAMLALGGRF